ncbi:competence/damage-inducible protein A [Hansschlegelia plantiphila]|uniref:Molybdenum cofactor biosynthesis protein n=1 Tax=Hansschlegelia plantiphila TaxID=374655 RepID=A0A9W6J2H0_9HYPH|nr:molybdopterin-binding protein [Hansschlegelia plantiphila]GLK68168.1 molybdenum cofactor biosynthesis protein [Hansschlegelia plantiphila]
MPAETEAVTAAVLVIGDEVLSGRTRDANSGYIASYLTNIGVDLREVRVVPDDEDAIVEAVNALRARFTYVFTTGGIGPTHDDITADAIARAFGVGIDHDPRAVAMLRERFANPADLNEGRLRMARIPFGADLIANRVSKAPGFRIGNVMVMAGVPSIMQAMMDVVGPTLRQGVRIESASIRADAKEGDIALPLAAVQKAHPGVAIGSYPYVDETGFNTNIVLRSRDPAGLAAATAAVEAMLRDLPRG